MWLQASGVCSSRTIYGPQRCATIPTNYPVCSSEMFGYLWCTFLHFPYTAKCIGEWARGWDRANWFQRSFWLGQTSRNSLSALLCGYLRFCIVYIDTVDIKPITTRYGWTVVRVNWLTLCQECPRLVFWGRYCSSCTPPSFFPFWRICWSVVPMTPLWWLLCHFQALGYSSRVSELGPHQGYWLVWPLGDEVECE